jgi:hypothetical protein
MDCKTARLLLEFTGPRRPAELEAGDAAALESHLLGCPDCAGAARAERGADEVLGRAMRDVPVPAGLRTRLLTHLEAERDVRYRRRSQRWLGAGAAAAALVAALWLGFDSWRYHHRSQLVLENATRLLEQQCFNPTPENVELWFAQTERLATRAPGDFNYALLTYYDTADLQGQRVPLLLFTSGRFQARVYILSDRQFDLQKALAAPPVVASGCKAEVRLHPGDPHFAYLIVYTSETLEPFTENQPTTT